MLRVVVLGYGELAQSVVLGILQTKHKLAGIMRWRHSKTNRLASFLQDTFAPDHLLSIIRSQDLKEIKAVRANTGKFTDQMKKLRPDVIIVASWGEILKSEAIDLPKVACINCHPSLLPKHRGSNPYASAIRQGETKTGVTFHLMNEKIDAGDILLQSEVEISEIDTGETLKRKCAFTAKEAVKILLDRLERAEAVPVAQDESKASYFPAISADDAYINWENPAESIHNQVRGLHPWVQCYTRYKNGFLFAKSSEVVKLDKPAGKHGVLIEKSENELVISTASPDKAIRLKGVEPYSFFYELRRWLGLTR